MTVTSPSAAGAVSGARGHDYEHGLFQVLEAREGSPPHRVAMALGNRRPAALFLMAALLGYVLLSGAAIATGLLVTKVMLQIGPVARADEWAVTWLSRHRSPFPTELSLAGSILAGGVVIPTVVALSAATLACLRRWLAAAFLVAAITLEVATYRITTLVVHRERPGVPRLEHLATNASFPSGHTAASVAAYGGLALLLSSCFRSRWTRLLCWMLACVIPLFVAFARMYRGMHHPADCVAGALIGIASLSIALFAARAANASRPDVNE